MKHRWIAIIFLSLLFLFSLPVYAHPGRTDGNGGHTNHSTGEYHYHHGYGAHQHYDIDGDGDIDCPHDFNDNTDHRSSNSNIQANTKETTKAVPDASRIISESVTSAHKAQQKVKVTAKDIVEIILVVILFYLTGIGLINRAFMGVFGLLEKAATLIAKRDIKIPDIFYIIFFTVFNIACVVAVIILMLRDKGIL